MLHHYDKIGLLSPSKRTDSNYRMYNNDDISRLYQILIFKELEFPLQEIKQILDDKDFDRREALKVQRNLIFEKKKRLERILQSIDDTIEDLGGNVMSKDNFAFIIFFKHWENIGRMIRKEEIGLRSTIRGDKRYNKQ